MRRGLVLVLAWLLPSAAIAQTRAGVIVVGPDSAAVGAAQKTLETRLAGPSVTVRGATEFASVIGGPAATTANAWVQDAPARATFDAAMAEVKRSYFSDLMPQATAKLDEAATILENAIDVPGTVRVKVSLWRAAVALRQNQKEAAIGELNVALLLVPNLVPEPNSPPPMVQLLDQLRAKAPKPFKVQLRGLPANAVVKVDDVVLAAGSIEVVPGPHVIDVISPGFRPFNKSFDATADTAIDVVLVQSIAPAWEKLFDAIVVRGEVAENEKKSLESLAARERLDYLVIAAVKPGEIRSAVWRRSDGRVQTTVAADAETIATWAATALDTAKTVAVAPTPTPKPAATPKATPTAIAMVTATPPVATPVPTPAVTPGVSRTQLAVETGLAYVRWTRAIESANAGGGYEVPGLGGGGPRVRVRGGTRSVVGELEVAYFSFGAMRTENRASQPVEVPGGSMLSARLGAGWRRAFGPVVVGPSLGVFHESYSAKDIAGGDGIFPSHARSGVDVRLGATMPAGPVVLLVEGGVAPFSTWTEDPDGATGKDPKPTAAMLRLGADVAVGGNGRLAFEYTGDFRKVRYSETGGNALAPEKAVRTEALAVFGLSFRYRF